MRWKRRRTRRRAGATARRPWGRIAVEVVALGSVALAATVAALGRLADMLAGAAGWLHLVGFATAVLGLGILTAVLLTGWLALRLRLARWTSTAPATAAILVAGVAAWLAAGPEFQADVSSLRMLVGGRSETQRETIAHQVYAAYRRSDLTALLRLLERARVYEPTILEAAATFDVDPEVLMGVAAAESAFYPRDSADGGRGLFQITAAPADAVTDVKRRLGVAQIDPLNQRHNAFLAAATLRRYLDEMHGDPFLGLLAYNIGPRNGGLRAIMEQYGARDFVTIQPYLHTLPRDYPIRVLAAALAYRLWHTEGRLPRYEDGSNAVHIQSVGIPGLTAHS